MKYNFDEIIPRENTNCYKYDLREKIFGIKDVLPMWVADMDFSSPPCVTDAIINRARHPVYGYTFRSASYYEAVSGWMKKRFNWNVEQKDISFSPGIVSAINLCVQKLTKPNDGIIIQSPVYFPFFSAISNNGRRILNNQLLEKNNNYYIDFYDFEKKAADAAMFIFCHPHNPVGRLWTAEELEQIIDICKRHNVLIISDEIHHDMVLNKREHIPLASLSSSASEISICCTSPSKTFNIPGLATSSLIIPNPDLKKKYDDALEACHTGMGNIFGFVALEAAYKHGEDWLDQLLSYLRKNLKFLTEFINQYIPEISITIPEATYLAWLDFRKINIRHDKIQEFLATKAGIGLNEGKTFGPGGEGFQRLNFAVPKIKLEESLHKLEKAIHKI